jgi:hypothetical protein
MKTTLPDTLIPPIRMLLMVLAGILLAMLI